MKKTLFWGAVLIGIYLVATNANKITPLISMILGQSWKGVATFQGRDVKGVTV